MMTRKHYEAIASAIRTGKIEELMDFMKADNPNFNRAKFKAACEKPEPLYHGDNCTCGKCKTAWR